MNWDVQLLVGVAQMEFVQVPLLVEWGLMTVVVSKMSVVEVVQQHS